MSYTARFKNGENIIDVTSTGTFRLGRDFSPPKSLLEYNLAGGTSINRTGGAELIGKRSINREWAFELEILASNAEDADAKARVLQSFLNEEDCSFQYKNNELPEPIWGQLGAFLTYEIISAQVGSVNVPTYRLGWKSTNSYKYYVNIELILKPYAIGAKQGAAAATGGILLDDYGCSDGQARGVFNPPATTNKFTTPILCNLSAGSYLVVSANFDPRYVLHAGEYSFAITSFDNANNTYTSSLNVGNTNSHAFSAYVMKPDFSEVTSGDCQIYYGGAKASTYTNLGGGLYRVSWIGAGIASPTATGLIIPSGATIYLLGYQVEEQSFVSPLCWGDLPGCAWTGTAHASTSTRTAGLLVLSTIHYDGFRVVSTDYEYMSGSVYMTVRFDVPNTYASQMYLFAFDGGISALFDPADDKIKLYNSGGAYGETAALTFSAGQVYHLAFVWSGTRWSISVNGTVTTNVWIAWLPTTGAGRCYIGTSTTPSLPIIGSIYGFTLYKNVLSTAQMTALYSASSGAATAETRVEWLPYYLGYSIDTTNPSHGDGIIQSNYYDSTHRPYGILADIPGDYFADTQILAYTGGTVHHNISLSDWQNPPYPSTWAADKSGTVLAGAIGGSVTALSITTTGTVIAGGNAYRINQFEDAAKKSWYVYVVDSEAALTDQTIYARAYSVMEAQYQYSQWQAIVTTTTRRLHRIGPVPPYGKGLLSEMVKDYRVATNIAWGIEFKRASGTATLNVDYIAAAPENTAYLYNNGSASYFSVRKTEAAGFQTAFFQINTLLGRILEASPNRYNVLYHQIGDQNGAFTNAETASYYVFVTPRWSLV
jgi:hypothetical protein